MSAAAQTEADRKALSFAMNLSLMVGLMAFTLPNGYVVGLVTGWALHAVMKKHDLLRDA